MIKIWQNSEVKDIHTALAIAADLMGDKYPVENDSIFYIKDLDVESCILRITTFQIPVSSKDGFAMILQDCLGSNYNVVNEYDPENGKLEQTLLIKGLIK